MYPKDRLRVLGGFASRSELLAHRCTPEEIDLAVRFRWILPVRKGYYASRDLDPLLLRAVRVGGILACVSAIAWHEGRTVPDSVPVHVLVAANASRLGTGAIVHWTRRDLAGSRLVVDESVARWQAASCRVSR